MMNISLKLAIIHVLILLKYTYSDCCSNSEEQLKAYLNEIEKKYEQISIDMGNAYWNFYSGENEYNLDSSMQQYKELLYNNRLNKTIEKWYSKRNSISDTLLKRRVEIWNNVLIVSRVEFDNEVLEQRKKLEYWFNVANKTEKPSYEIISEELLKLVKLRNKKAQEIGYDNYVHLSFETNYLGFDWFFQFINELDISTKDDYIKKLSKFNFKEKATYKDVIFLLNRFSLNQAFSESQKISTSHIAENSLGDIGFDLSTLPINLKEKKLPSGIGGQGISINIPHDFNIVIFPNANLHILMHEIGHGLQGVNTQIGIPILEGYEWIYGSYSAAFSEGLAEVIASFTRNFYWQEKHTILTNKEIIKRKATMDEFACVFIRFQIYNIMNEIDLYLHPETTYLDIKNKNAKKYLMLSKPITYDNDLNNIMYITYPLYLQNYLLADIISTQIHSTLMEKFGEDYVFNKEVGTFIIKYFYKDGEYFPWQERLKQATGRELDIVEYLNYYNIELNYR